MTDIEITADTVLSKGPILKATGYSNAKLLPGSKAYIALGEAGANLEGTGKAWEVTGAQLVTAGLLGDDFQPVKGTTKRAPRGTTGTRINASRLTPTEKAAQAVEKAQSALESANSRLATAEERLTEAKARVKEATKDLKSAQHTFDNIGAQELAAAEAELAEIEKAAAEKKARIEALRSGTNPDANTTADEDDAMLAALRAKLPEKASA